jgi:phage terminase small subunit
MAGRQRRAAAAEPEPEPAITTAPPRHLSARARQLWTSVVPVVIEAPEQLVLLAAALEALDRADLCRREIARAGMTTRTRGSGVLHVHPLVKVEAEARRQFTDLWARLRLGQERDPVKRLKNATGAAVPAAAAPAGELPGWLPFQEKKVEADPHP